MDTQDAIIETLYKYTQAIVVALGYRDQQTHLHSERVSMLSVELGKRCGLSAWEMGILRISASLHDVGKIGIQDSILAKPGALDAAEWEQMKQHTVIGQNIILAIDIPGSLEAASVVRHHHEHFDGSGYPDGIAGKDIPLCARIISITDSYDAMAVTRTYHRQRTHEEILEVLTQEAVVKHDPALLDEFRGLIADSSFRAR